MFLIDDQSIRAAVATDTGIVVQELGAYQYTDKTVTTADGSLWIYKIIDAGHIEVVGIVKERPVLIILERVQEETPKG